MQSLLGRVITGLIIDKNEENYFVQKQGVTFKLQNTDDMKDMAIGETMSGFVYENSQHELIMTTAIPNIQVGHYAFGEVVETRRDLGVFVNIGLPDKDIVVSIDDLPTLTKLWPKKGDRLFISLTVDKKNRLWGQLADEVVFKSIAKKADQSMQNKNITGTVYRLKMSGTFLLTDDFCQAFIHPSERQQEPRLGQVVNGRVIGIRPEGTLNVSLKPRAHEEIQDDAAMILAVLKRESTHAIHFGDKSNPDEIRQYFGISKASFKRALGTLLKNGLIAQIDGVKTILTAKGENMD